MYAAMAYTYAINCHNVCVLNYTNRIACAIKAHFKVVGDDYYSRVSKPRVQMILDRIKGIANESDAEEDSEDAAELLSVADEEFIGRIRQFFDIRGMHDFVLNDETVSSNVEYMPLFFAHLLRYLDEVEENNVDISVERFHVLPMCDIKPHSIPYGNKQK